MKSIKGKAKRVKAKIYRALRIAPGPRAGFEGQLAPQSRSVSTPGPPAVGTTSKDSAGGEGTVRLSSDIIADASRAVRTMQTPRALSAAGALEDALQPSQNDVAIDVFSPLVARLAAFLSFVDVISEIHPYAKMALFIFTYVAKVAGAQMTRDAALSDLLSTIADIYNFVNKYKDVKELDTGRQALLRDLSLQTVDCAYFIRDQAQIKSFYRRVGRNALTGSAIDGQIATYKDAFNSIRQRLTERGVLEIELRVFKTLSSIDDDLKIQNLTHIRGAGRNSDKECLPGTRTQILDDLSTWVNDPDASRVRFLIGTAGRGKSAIAHSLASRFDALRRLGCFFAFDRNFQRDHHPEFAFSTVAHELAGWSPDFKSALAKALRDKDSLTHTTDITAQWKELIINPAKHITVIGPVLVVIDAFDESSSSEQSPRSRQILLKRLIEGASDLPDGFRILVTSRPERDVIAMLNSPSFHADPTVTDSVNLDAQTAGLAEDIATYVRHTLHTGLFDDGELDEDQIKLLVQKAEGLFQWVATACRELLRNPAGTTLQHRFNKRLGNIIHHGSSSLDGLYSNILQQHFPPEETDALFNFRSVMAQILCASQPLSIAALQGLRSAAGIGERNDVALVLRYMGALLSDVDNDVTPIRPLHTSFRDFLLDETRSGAWHIDQETGHRTMFRGSVVTLHREVRFNICEIETSYKRNSDIPGLRDRIKTQSLVYAAGYLKDHIPTPETVSAMIVSPLRSTLQELFCKKLLLWLELLSVLGYINTTTLVLQRIAAHFSNAAYRDTRAALQDAVRFVRQFALPISQSAPHIYLSALAFSPESSITRNTFVSLFPYIPSVSGSSRLWPPLQTVLRVNTLVLAVAWSQDGRHIIAGMYDGRIIMWDAATSELIERHFDGHPQPIDSICFSPDGQRIVSGSRDSTVRIWDVATGDAIGNPLNGHETDVTAVVYSPDGRLIASASSDSTIRIWDANTGVAAGVLSQANSPSGVKSAAFSPSGQHIASGSTDHTVRIWDISALGSSEKSLKGHSSDVLSVCYSPDGRRIVSGSADRTLRIWDTDRYEAIGEPLRGHADIVGAVAYSPDGRRIISCSSDSTIRVWDAESGAAIGGPVRGHSVAIYAIAYSPDGHQIASGSGDFSVRVWSADMLETNDGTLGLDYPSGVYIAVYSPDGLRFASGWGDSKIQTYWAESGEMIGRPFTGHIGLVRAISYSPDGCSIVSGGYDGTIRIWNADTGEHSLIADNNSTNAVLCVAYSPDGRHIACGFRDSTVWFYDPDTHETAGEPLRGHTNLVWTIAYSPNSQHLLSGSGDLTLRAWDTRTRKQTREPLKGLHPEVMGIAFSPDGCRVAAIWEGNIVRIFDASTLTVSGEPLCGHSHLFLSIAYSRNGRRIVSSSYDLSVRIWDAETSQAIGAPFYGHSDLAYSVAFHLSGQFVLSSSRDSVMRIWELEPEQADGVDIKPASETTVQSSKGAASQQPLLDFRYPDQGHSSQANLNIPPELHWEDGWIVDSDGNLLIWVPHEYRHSLPWPRTHKLVVGAGRKITIDFASSRHGMEWAKCTDNKAEK